MGALASTRAMGSVWPLWALGPPSHVIPCRFLGSLYGRCRMKLKEADFTVGDSAFLKVIENASSPLGTVGLGSRVLHAGGILLFETYSILAQPLQNFRSTRLRWELVHLREGMEAHGARADRTPTSRFFLHTRPSERILRSCASLPTVPRISSGRKISCDGKTASRLKLSSQIAGILWNRCRILNLLLK